MANLTRYNPYSDAISLRDAMDRLFADSFISPRTLGQGVGQAMPANLFETDNSFILQIPVAGAKPEDVEITTQQDTVTVKWETSTPVPEGAKMHWHGFQSSQYQQSFTLPMPINAERAQANIENGILTLTLPKAEHAKARTIKVNTSNNQ